ncbi:hypothetical protein HMPREF3121_02550 [Corynebacterium sp. HMSC11E11]|nr:hypothetical protein HMPREF3121_02550 [Corynebacterium sp. HMSC11E11]
MPVVHRGGDAGSSLPRKFAGESEEEVIGMPSGIGGWIWLIGFGVPGALVIMVGVVLAGFALRARTWPKSVGHVIGGEEYFDQEEQCAMFREIVAFRDERGVEHEARTNMSTSDLVIGKEVEVRYNPRDPREVLVGTVPLGFVALAVVLLGIVFVGIGVTSGGF